MFLLKDLCICHFYFILYCAYGVNWFSYVICFFISFHLFLYYTVYTVSLWSSSWWFDKCRHKLFISLYHSFTWFFYIPLWTFVKFRMIFFHNQVIKNLFLLFIHCNNIFINSILANSRWFYEIWKWTIFWQLITLTSECVGSCSEWSVLAYLVAWQEWPVVSLMVLTLMPPARLSHMKGCVCGSMHFHTTNTLNLHNLLQM